MLGRFGPLGRGALLCALLLLPTLAAATDNYDVLDADRGRVHRRAVDLGNGTKLDVVTPADPTGQPYTSTNTPPRPTDGATNSAQVVGNGVLSAIQGLLAAPVTRTGAITQTVVTLAPGTSAQLLAANASRKWARWMVVGTGPMTVAPGATPAVVGAGMAYDPAAGVGRQGGSESLSDPVSATGAFQAISTAGTVVVVWECQ